MLYQDVPGVAGQHDVLWRRSLYDSNASIADFIFYIRYDRDAIVTCCGAGAAGRTPLSIDVSCQHGAQQQTAPHAE